MKVSLVYAGKYKVERNPWEPLPKEARDEMQREVNYYHEQFLNAVARGRGTTVANVRANYGRGRLFQPEEAIRRGMADRIGTLQSVVRTVSQQAAADRRRRQAARSGKRRVLASLDIALAED